MSYNHFTDYRQIKPIDLFNLSSDFTWNELKNAYRKIALKVHPDKGGNKEIFDHCTTCFKQLAYELKMKDSNKTHSQLKQNFKTDDFSFLKPNMSDDGNFQQKFNKLFDENKFLDEDSEFGYGDKMLKSTKNREDFDIKNIFGTEKVTHEKFHKTFDTKVKPRKDIIKYQEPQALHLTKTIQFSELGNKTTDYTGSSDNHKLSYTDYMKAHSEERIPTTNNRKEFKNTKEYQLYSDKYINQSFSSEEIRRQQKAKSLQEKYEHDRRLRLRDKDEQIGLYYDKISRLLVK